MNLGNVIALNEPVHAGKQVWTDKQQQLLDMLKLEENRLLPVKTLCQKAGVSINVWYGAIKNPHYVAIVEALGGRVKRLGESHLDVHLAVAPEEELAKDIWEMRRLKSDYPKHKPPSGFKINFSWIVNPVLRKPGKRLLPAPFASMEGENLLHRALIHAAFFATSLAGDPSWSAQPESD